MDAPLSTDGVALNQFRERIMVDGDQYSNIAISFRNNRHEGCYLYDYHIKIAIEEDR
jgi:hypothetical protein